MVIDFVTATLTAKTKMYSQNYKELRVCFIVYSLLVDLKWLIKLHLPANNISCPFKSFDYVDLT